MALFEQATNSLSHPILRLMSVLCAGVRVELCRAPHCRITTNWNTTAFHFDGETYRMDKFDIPGGQHTGKLLSPRMRVMIVARFTNEPELSRMQWGTKQRRMGLRLIAEA